MGTNKGAKPKPLWSCPQCQRKFAKANQWHSCGEFTVEQYLDGKPAEIVALFDRLVELAKVSCPMIVAPTKSMVLFKARTSFAEVKAKNDRLDVHVAFSKRVRSPRFRRQNAGLGEPGSNLHLVGSQPKAVTHHPFGGVANNGKARRAE